MTLYVTAAASLVPAWWNARPLMPGFSSWHFLAAAIMSSHVAGTSSPIRSLRQIIDHVSPSSGSP